MLYCTKMVFCQSHKSQGAMVKKAIIQERNSQFGQEAVMHLLCEEKTKISLIFSFLSTRQLLANLLLQMNSDAVLHQVK